MKPLLSLIYVTYRPGGIDLLAMGLASQWPAYELIVVDGFPGRPERGEAAEHLRKRGIPLAWFGPPRPKSFETPLDLANAMNTGAMHAKTRKLVFLHDFTYPLPDLIDRWLTSFEENGTRAIITGTARIYRCDPPEVEGDISVWNGSNSMLKIDQSIASEHWIPERCENFHCGISLNYFEEVNGIDERADGHISWPLECMTTQALRLGYRLVVDRNCHVGMMDHRSWQDGEKTGLWHAERKPAMDPRAEPGWGRVSCNPYLFVEERRKIQEGKQ